MTKPKSTPRWIAVTAWLVCGASTIILPSSVPGFEVEKVNLVSNPPPEGEAQARNVLVFDNNLLDRLFGKHRASVKARNETVPADNQRAPNLFEGAASSPITPTGSLLAGITRDISPRRAAALRLAEKGRVLLQNREYQKALYPLEQALGLDANPVIYFYLARTHYHIGNYDRVSGFLQVAEYSLVQQVEWMNEVVALRTAVSAFPASQHTVPKRNVGWTSRD